MDRINWRLVLPVFLAGAAAVYWGLALGDFDSATWSAVLIEVGAAIGLVGLLVVLERRMLRQTAELVESTTTAAVDRATAGLRERVVRLENLDEAQAAERERRHGGRQALLDALLASELTATSVGEIIAAAEDERLIDGGRFRVRTSPEPDSHVLHFLALRAAGEVPVLWLDFEAFEMGHGIEAGDGWLVPAPAGSPTTVMWIHDQTAAEIASDLEAGLEAENRPLHGFRFRYALEQLSRSVQVMRTARAATANDPRRMQGLLRMLINEEWAITSFGLESVTTAAAFPIRWASMRGGPPASVWYGTDVTVDDSAPKGDPNLWADALDWITRREGWQVLRPGETQPHPISRLRAGPTS